MNGEVCLNTERERAVEPRSDLLRCDRPCARFPLRRSLVLLLLYLDDKRRVVNDVLKALKPVASGRLLRHSHRTVFFGWWSVQCFASPMRAV